MSRLIFILALTISIYQFAAATDKEGCPVQVLEIYAPMCANNGKTYSNIYELKAANCDSDTEIKVASQGPCEPSANSSDTSTKIKKDGCPIIAIPTIFDPVCGDDGKTYNNLWLLKSANCDSPDKDIKLASEGDCAAKPVNPVEGDKKECPVICPANFAPVCGDNGKTYSNKCAMEVESCQSGKEIKLAFAGSCDDKPKVTEKPGCPINFCTFEYAPICGSDGKTYSNECGLKSANCLSEKDITIASKGPCTNKKTDEATTSSTAAAAVKTGCPVENCTREFVPVCGNDGETYTNECRLREANCKATGKDIIKASDGSCAQQHTAPSATKTK